MLVFLCHHGVEGAIGKRVRFASIIVGLRETEMASTITRNVAETKTTVSGDCEATMYVEWPYPRTQ